MILSEGFKKHCKRQSCASFESGGGLFEGKTPMCLGRWERKKREEQVLDAFPMMKDLKSANPYFAAPVNFIQRLMPQHSAL